MSSVQSSDNRIKWLDMARAIAILCVVICHINDNVYSINAEFMTSLGFIPEFIALFLRTLGRAGGVPICLMLTGYLLLDRDYDEQAMKHFWKDKWLHLLICTWIWIVIDRIFMYFIGRGVSVTDTVREILFLKSVELGHAWYMPMIIGMYLLIPFVARGLKKINPSAYLPVIIILILMVFAYPTLYSVNHLAVLNSIVGRELSLQINLGFSGGAYGMYMIFGYLIKTGLFKKIRSYILWIVFALAFLGTVFFQIWMFAGGYSYDLWYNNLLVFITSASLFELMSRTDKVYAYPAVKVIAYYSFAIYLVHNLILLAVFKVLKANDIHIGYVPAHVIMLIAVTGLALAVVWAISKIPKAGKYIFYLK